MRVGILYWTCTSVKLVAFYASADHSLCLRFRNYRIIGGRAEDHRRIKGGRRDFYSGRLLQFFRC